MTARAIERRRGGFFVIDDVDGWSGPWRTEAAAQAAERGDYDTAQQLHRVPTIDRTFRALRAAEGRPEYE